MIGCRSAAPASTGSATQSGAHLKSVNTDCRSSSGNENWNDRQVVAAPVEVLQVQGVVMHLFDCAAVEARGAHLELEHQNDAANDQDHVRALAHARDGELKKDVPSAQVTKRALQHGDLLQPSIPLLMLEREAMRASELSQNSIIIC